MSPCVACLSDGDTSQLHWGAGKTVSVFHLPRIASGHGSPQAGRAKLMGLLLLCSVPCGRVSPIQVMVTYVNCKLGSNVVKHGWNNLFNRYSSGQSIFREYGSSGPGASLTKRKLGKAYKGPAPASLQLRSYIGAELADQAQRLSKVFGTSTPFYD